LGASSESYSICGFFETGGIFLTLLDNDPITELGVGYGNYSSLSECQSSTNCNIDLLIDSNINSLNKELTCPICLGIISKSTVVGEVVTTF
jgi:hypothetical protein